MIENIAAAEIKDVCLAVVCEFGESVTAKQLLLSGSLPVSFRGGGCCLAIVGIHSLESTQASVTNTQFQGARS